MAKTNPPIKEKYIESPDVLLRHFKDFVKFEVEHPLYKREYVGKDGNPVDTALQVPITFEGFECYCFENGIIKDLGHYASNRDGAYDAYVTIITYIRTFCFSNNFKGAAVGLFNPNIIAKKLGLVEKSQVEQTNIEQPLFPNDTTK